MSDLLQSISRQKSLSFDLLILDNGSTDGTPERAEIELANLSLIKNKTFIRSEENLGAAEGLRRLLLEAKTVFCCVIHGDDLLDPDYTQTVLKFLQKEPRVDALNVHLRCFETLPGQTRRVYRPLWTSSRLLNGLLVSGLNPGLMPGSVLRKAWILEKGLLDLDMPLNGIEDGILWMRLIRSGGSIRVLSRPIYYYRLHEAQFSREKNRNSFFFGIARSINIKESDNWFQRLLARAEISYELSFFEDDANYKLALGGFIKKHKLYSLLRPINILIRRMALMLNYLRDNSKT